MTKIELKQMEVTKGGDFVGGLCVGLAAGSAVYTIGALTQWWNPVGWVSIAFIAADVACGVGYASTQL